MKQSRKLTRQEKEILTKHYMCAADWRFLKKINDSYFQVVHETTGRTKIVSYY